MLESFIVGFSRLLIVVLLEGVLFFISNYVRAFLPIYADTLGNLLRIHCYGWYILYVYILVIYVYVYLQQITVGS